MAFKFSKSKMKLTINRRLIIYFFENKILPLFLIIFGEKWYLRIKYRLKLGRKLNLNNPQLFTEKLQWLKLHERSDLIVICADKIKAKEYVGRIIGFNHIIPVLRIFDNINQISHSNLPDSPFVIKTNHDSGGVLIFDFKCDIDFNKIKKILSRKMRRNFYFMHLEWEYKNINPKIFIEKKLIDESKNFMLNDFKIHCFNGKPMFIQTIFDRAEGVKEGWYDVNWKKLEMFYFSLNTNLIERPTSLAEMLDFSEKLAKPFSYVRIDFYSINNLVLFGEFTFRPYGGFMKWNNPEWDIQLGKLLKLDGQIGK
jgi:hypothetical protein